ncbi:hypothetical protein BDZ89DRAFT_965924 [Hymenopellis radicata]|nr:hypothetical protein BDZ89DRAFT_965924 [Hymenopellis radicata]
MGLDTLPYDVLLVVATFLDLNDVHSLHLTCRSLRDFSMTRPIYRQLAHDLLARCRPLPLRGFTQPSDLSAADLMRTVNKAHRSEHEWRSRAPRPIQATYPLGVHPQSNYLDCFDDNIIGRTRRWYRRLTLVDPWEEIEVDWLSSITSNYILCATKSGKVLCWDIISDTQIAEWSLGPEWELWKCRVDFERRYVYFAMAEKPDTDFDSDITDFVIVQLYFPQCSTDGAVSSPPQFSQLATCRTAGLVMNFFLLDPLNRTIACFVQIPKATNGEYDSIGLYMLPDWDKSSYIFIDTGLEHGIEANWSCILLDDALVVHSEETTAAYQHIYPLSLLRKSLRPTVKTPVISGHVPPFQTLKRNFTYRKDNSISTESSDPSIPADPFPMPPWTSESAHFVRQWWPKFQEGHRASSSVLLLHDMEARRGGSFALAQHYFMVPMSKVDLRYPPPSTCTNGASTRQVIEGPPLPMWYVRSEFEICAVLELEEHGEERRPLIAVDFGHAAWIEYVDEDTEKKALRFVTFPPLEAAEDVQANAVVFTLEIPSELNLDKVETINLDQSHGTIILSVGGGEVFILCYE